jgi:hypothetical protein
MGRKKEMNSKTEKKCIGDGRKEEKKSKVKRKKIKRREMSKGLKRV